MSRVAGINLFTTNCRFTREQLDYLDREHWAARMSRSDLIRELLDEAIAAREAIKTAGDPS